MTELDIKRILETMKQSSVSQLKEQIRRLATDLIVAKSKLKVADVALDQISDPRKRDHREPDKYTEVGCMMHIADQALEKIRSDGSVIKCTSDTSTT